MRFVFVTAPAALRSLIVDKALPVNGERLELLDTPVGRLPDRIQRRMRTHLDHIIRLAAAFSIAVAAVVLTLLVVAVILFARGEQIGGAISGVFSGSGLLAVVIARPWSPWLDAVVLTTELEVAYEAYQAQRRACGDDPQCIGEAVRDFLSNVRSGRGGPSRP